MTLIGGMALDLSQADLPPEGLTLTKVSVIGGVRLVVPEGVTVRVRRFLLIGGTKGLAPAGAGPTLTVRSFGLVGGVDVRVAR